MSIAEAIQRHEQTRRRFAASVFRQNQDVGILARQHVPFRTIGRPVVAAACALLAACAPSPAPVQAIPPGPTPVEVADYATAQMQYRSGLATGNGDAVAEANETFRQISREIFSRQDPKLFEAEVYASDTRWPGRPPPVAACPHSSNRNARTSNGATTKQRPLSGGT